MNSAAELPALSPEHGLIRFEQPLTERMRTFLRIEFLYEQTLFHVDEPTDFGARAAIAGLLDNISQEDKAAIPILGSLPIIGPLFKSKADRRERTELMVLITPRLVRPLDPDEVPPLPTEPGRFLPQSEGGVGQDLKGSGGTVDAPTVKTEQARAQGPR